MIGPQLEHVTGEWNTALNKGTPGIRPPALLNGKQMLAAGTFHAADAGHGGAGNIYAKVTDTTPAWMRGNLQGH